MYQYSQERGRIFTDDGQRDFLKVRDHVKKLLSQAGAVRMQEAVRVISGDSWFALACVDRLVELKEIREVAPNAETAGQYRIFTTVE